MKLVLGKILCLAAGLTVTSAVLAAEGQQGAKAGKTSKKAKTQAAASSDETVVAAPVASTPKSATQEGVLLFDSIQARGRPRVALVFKESEDFKDVPNLTGLKTPEAPTPPEKPKSPASEPTARPTENGAPSDAPVSRAKTPEELESQKAENAAAEAAELPVDLGPVE